VVSLLLINLKRSNYSINSIFIIRTPVRWAKSISLDTLFDAVQRDKCETTYGCELRSDKSHVTQSALMPENSVSEGLSDNDFSLIRLLKYLHNFIHTSY